MLREVLHHSWTLPDSGTACFRSVLITQRFERLFCGAVVDLWNGQQVGMLKFTTGCQELYDVQLLLGVQRPMILNQERKEIRQAFTAPDFNYWLQPSVVIPNN